MVASASIVAARNELARLVGEAHVHSATAADAVDGVSPQFLVEPGNADELAAVLRGAQAANLRVVPRGGGTKMEWGHAPRGLDFILSTWRLNRVLEHAWADMTATVEAGCTVASFQHTLAQHGQRLALDPLWPERATIGGVLATNDSGALRQRFGSLRDLILGITVALPDGTLARSGGKVVKNVAGYDLPKLFTGSLGTLGVITQATFRLYPSPAQSRTTTLTAPSREILDQTLQSILDSTLVPSRLQIRAKPGVLACVDVSFEGSAAGIESQVNLLLRRCVQTGKTDSSPAIWKESEKLWENAASAVLSKVSFLPAQCGAICELVDHHTQPRGMRWQMVAQALGMGWLRLEGGDEESLRGSIEKLRAEIAAREGSLVVYHCPDKMKSQIDVWGDVGNALPLMRRIKNQFDPDGILNPGRFVGDI